MIMYWESLCVTLRSLYWYVMCDFARGTVLSINISVAFDAWVEVVPFALHV